MTIRSWNDAKPGSLHRSLIDNSDHGVSIHYRLSRGAYQIVAKYGEQSRVWYCHANQDKRLRDLALAQANEWLAARYAEVA